VTVAAAETAVLVCTAVHFGFQATVTAIVYPALARTPPPQWTIAHQAHTRAITPVVAVVYGMLALSGGWALLSGPRFWTLAALIAVVATVLTTTLAARLHGCLAAGHDDGLIRRLLRVDRVRAATAALALVAALGSLF
jgi:hypothetical protein